MRLYRKEPDKDCPTGLRRIDGRCAKIGKAKAARLTVMPPESHTLARDRYDIVGGRLYHRHGEALELIRDFTEMTFEPIRAPYDWREMSDDAATARDWHPLDGDPT